MPQETHASCQRGGITHQGTPEQYIGTRTIYWPRTPRLPTMGLEEGSRGWRQKKKGRSKCVSTDRGEGAPLPSGGGLPPTKVEQVLPPELQANGGAAAALASVGKPVNGAASDQPSSSADPAPDIRVDRKSVV